jgi:GNAT superfamily N-acetyltransferase
MERTMISSQSFLPGRLILRRGCARDYRRLHRFHYRAASPATWDQVWTVKYLPSLRGARYGGGETVAVAVLSYPIPSCLARRRALRLRGTPEQELRFANRHLRTISRVIVHPQFRALGLSSRLVRCICRNCSTRYVEALAVMGRAHPFLERGGMRRHPVADAGRPAYFLFDRSQGHRAPRSITRSP